MTWPETRLIRIERKIKKGVERKRLEEKTLDVVENLQKKRREEIIILWL
jgi:hypothetical protein